jgi:hypothetical protein
MNEAPQSDPSAETRPHYGPLLMLGLPFAIEILTLYLLIAVETPLTPVVNRLQENAFGLFTLACMALMVVCAVMFIVLSIAERRRRRRHVQGSTASG